MPAPAVFDEQWESTMFEMLGAALPHSIPWFALVIVNPEIAYPGGTGLLQNRNPSAPWQSTMQAEGSPA